MQYNARKMKHNRIKEIQDQEKQRQLISASFSMHSILKMFVEKGTWRDDQEEQSIMGQ